MIGKDSLTGLYNRRTGRQFLDLFWKKAHEEHTTFCLAMGDIDFFKNVNDTYGHDAGDEVLKKILLQSVGAEKNFCLVLCLAKRNLEKN